jgi:hypothetical protein
MPGYHQGLSKQYLSNYPAPRFHRFSFVDFAEVVFLKSIARHNA